MIPAGIAINFVELALILKLDDGMLAILPFLIQWIALGQLGSQLYLDRPVQQSYPLPKSHWTLLHELQQLPEEEIDHFLPQVCNMVMDRESLGDDDLFNYFESVIERKCAECFTFGTRVCGVLKATQQTPPEGLFKSILTPNAMTQRFEERLRAFQERVEYVTAYGQNLPLMMSELRGSYFRDYQFLLDSLARLGTELKGYPVARRNMHLRHATSQFNALLYYRMASRGSVSSMETPLQDFRSYPDLSAQNIATLMPTAAQYSLHLPLHHCQDKVQRILRFVESECEVLPSKERCPYVVVVEVLTQNFDCKSELLYNQGTQTQSQPTPAYLSNGMSNSQMLRDRQTALSNSASSPEPHRTPAPSVDMIAAPIEQRQSSGVISEKSIPIPRRARRGSTLLSDSLVFGTPATTGSARHRRRGHRLHPFSSSSSSRNIASISAPMVEESCRDDAHHQDLEESLEQLQEAYELYDEALKSSDSGGSDEVDLDGPTAPPLLQVKPTIKQTIKQNQNAQLFARPDTDGAQSNILRTDPEVHAMEVLGATPTADCESLEDHYAYIDPKSESKAGSQAESEGDPPPGPLNSLRGGNIADGGDHQQSSSEIRAPSPTTKYVPRRRSFARSYVRNKARSATALPQRREPPIDPRSSPLPPCDDASGEERINAPQEVFPAQYSYADSNYPLPRNAQFEERTGRDYQADNEHSSVIDGRDRPHNHLHHHLQDHHNLQHQPLSAHRQLSPYPQHLQSPTGLPHMNSQVQQQPRAYVRPKTWQERKAIIKASSPFGMLPGWDMKSFIVKSGDDLRKEVLAMQLMEFCKKVFEIEGLEIYLRPYQILSTGAQAGLVEFLEGAESVDRIKKALPRGLTLKNYFELTFGESYSFFYTKAVQNFVRSLVGYSLLTYLVQVKDRHNANILFDQEGHVLHIDFGYILGDSPGFNINFESAPFKLTREYLEVMGGVESEAFKTFQDLFLKGFLVLQKHVDSITSIIQLFYGDKRRAAADGVRSRLLFPQSQSDILALIGDSLDNWRTKQYDWYQERTNNIHT